MTMTVPFPSGAMLIGDNWVHDSSGGMHEHIYPGSGRPNATVALAGPEEMDRAVRVATLAQREWIALPFDIRRDLMLRLADAVDARASDLIQLNTQDYGPPLAISAVHPMQLARWFRYYAGWVDKGHGQSTPVSMLNDINLIEREPYGVVAIIIPWNGPLFGIGMGVAPALAAGNAVVVKPPELAPLSSLLFAELCLEAGMPPGLINIVPGGPEGGEALVRHPGVRKIHFTGSGATARKIIAIAAENLTPVATELGGKSANIVFADADLDSAVALAAFVGPLGQSGQSCACGSRILVQDSIYDDFVERLVDFVQSMPVGNPTDPTTMVGPVVSAGAADRIMGVIADARDQKMGRLLTGGKRLGGPLADGYFIAPTIFGDVDNRSPLAAIETFGPVVSTMRFSSEAEAIALANDTTFGLVGYVHTENLRRAHRVARAIEAGTIFVNTYSDIAPTGPYGGYKQSGVGRLGGIEGLQEFQQTKTIRIAMTEDEPVAPPMPSVSVPSRRGADA